MPIDDPIITATCDGCQYTTDPIALTSLAGGGWDARNIQAKLLRWGWKIDGDRLTCPECQVTD